MERIQREAKGTIRNQKFRKDDLTSNIEYTGFTYWEQVNKYTEAASVLKGINLSFMSMVNRMERNWHELPQELLNIKKNFLMVKTLEYIGKKGHGVFSTDILKDLLDKLL